MSFFKITEHQKNKVELAIIRPLTFESINQSYALKEIQKIMGRKISQLTINCESIKDIDSCGLSLITYIKKNCLAKHIRLIQTSKKFEKLSALYLIDQNKTL